MYTTERVGGWTGERERRTEERQRAVEGREEWRKWFMVARIGWMEVVYGKKKVYK